MRFDLKQPCQHCPFRIDQPGYLHPDRAREIAETLLSHDWEWFVCHKTLDADEQQQCAGSLIFQLRQNAINVPSRLAVIQGLLDLDAIMRHAALIAETTEQLIAHHTKESYAGTDKPGRQP